MNRVDGVLDGVDYHQFYVVADNDPYAWPEGAFEDEISPHTLIVPTGHALCVSTGIAMGMINLTIEFLDLSPTAINDSRPWEAVSEVSFDADSTNGRIHLLMSSPEPPFESFWLPSGTGWYRVRSHAVGRSLDYDAVVDANPREFHLLQLWRTDRFEPAQHHRIDDQWADQFSED